VIEVVVPQISEVASEIVLVTWLKSEGEPVVKGEPLFELDTDKYVVEIEAFADGTLLEVVVPAGSVVEPGQVVARIGADGETAPSRTDADRSPATRDGAPRGSKVLASPKARRLAGELGVDLDAVTGTGTGGLISADDVLAAAGPARTAGSSDEGVEPLSDARRAIGARMQASKQSVPHFYVLVDVDMGEAVRLRARCVDDLGWERAPTFTDLIVLACGRALLACPEVNVKLADGGLRRRSTVDIGIAVGFEDGLIVPVVRDVDRLELRALSQATREAAERARSGRLLGADVAERSMVVSNLGMHGVDAFVAIVDEPDPVILAAGRVAERSVVIDGATAVGWRCTLALSADHRVLDGFAAARFLNAVKSELETASFLPEEA
jgi:pyruvate dehydrogenase E2 component (dihydrolipoamide acetyltransferase)